MIGFKHMIFAIKKPKRRRLPKGIRRAGPHYRAPREKHWDLDRQYVNKDQNYIPRHALDKNRAASYHYTLTGGYYDQEPLPYLNARHLPQRKVPNKITATEFLMPSARSHYSTIAVRSNHQDGEYDRRRP